MLNIVLFGPPGAGKGTQSAKIKEKYQLIHLSTGDLLRSEIAEGTELGLTAKKLMYAGKLVPDEVVIGMIDHKLKVNPDANGFIFDGFPRTVTQAEALDKLMVKNSTAISGMIALEVSEEELTGRLLKRGETSGRPDDQNVNMIKTRIHEYESKTAVVANYYKSQDKFKSVNGIGDIEEIFNKLNDSIDALK
ncbi:MAG: adenylate kinase [Flammeovirgaceae bacterium]|nr:adenylate kinase [Flammeovirgaceae bacterium]